MKKWVTYLERQKPELINISFTTDSNADIIIVIPCYNEPELLTTLQSISYCKIPDASVLVVVIINSGEQSDQEIVRQNRKTEEEIKTFSKNIDNKSITFSACLFEKLPKKHAGVGLARKIGMDLAVRHFKENENKRGIIVSLDADCVVSDNFLVSIYNTFRENDKLNCTVHNVFHRAEGNHPDIEKAVRQYETYLHYFSDSLKKIGFPYYYKTIGSSFAVSADAYVKVGGMGRQQGGEDFYFLQKIFELGNVYELKEVTVYPMARFSDRVPFGTGPALQKIIDAPQQVLRVYSRQSFHELKQLFDIKDSIFRKNPDEVLNLTSSLHYSLRNFLGVTEFMTSIADCNQNSASLKTFRKRFFHHFNAFRIIKYLNHVHPDPFELEEITTVTNNLT